MREGQCLLVLFCFHLLGYMPNGKIEHIGNTSTLRSTRIMSQSVQLREGLGLAHTCSCTSLFESICSESS